MPKFTVTTIVTTEHSHVIDAVDLRSAAQQALAVAQRETEGKWDHPVSVSVKSVRPAND